MTVTYTDLNANCPDPTDIVVTMCRDLAAAVRDFVCDTTRNIDAGLRAEITELADRIDVLGNTDTAALAQQLQLIQSLLRDANQDGQIDVIANLSTIVADARRAAELASADASASSALANTVLGQLASHQASTSAQIADLTTRASVLEATTADLATRNVLVQQQLDTVTTRIEGLASDADLSDAICANNTRLAMGLQAGMTAAIAIFARGCSISDQPDAVEPNPGDDDHPGHGNDHPGHGNDDRTPSKRWTLLDLATGIYNRPTPTVTQSWEVGSLQEIYDAVKSGTSLDVIRESYLLGNDGNGYGDAEVTQEVYDLLAGASPSDITRALTVAGVGSGTGG